MTNLPESRLAREAEICYGTVAWQLIMIAGMKGHDDVSVEAVIATVQQNVATAKAIIKKPQDGSSANGLSVTAPVPKH